MLILLSKVKSFFHACQVVKLSRKFIKTKALARPTSMSWRKRREKARGAALATPPALYTSERWMCFSTV